MAAPYGRHPQCTFDRLLVSETGPSLSQKRHPLTNHTFRSSVYGS